MCNINFLINPRSTENMCIGSFWLVLFHYPKGVHTTYDDDIILRLLCVGSTNSDISMAAWTWRNFQPSAWWTYFSQHPAATLSQLLHLHNDGGVTSDVFETYICQGIFTSYVEVWLSFVSLFFKCFHMNDTVLCWKETGTDGWQSCRLYEAIRPDLFAWEMMWDNCHD